MKGLNFYGWMNPRSGYGIVSLEYATALERLMGTVSIGWERQADLFKDDFDQLTVEQQTLLSKPFKKEKIGIIKTTPQLFNLNKSDFRIGYTMVENTMIGENWVKMCNDMDAIFVPSNYLIDVFTDCGVKKPIYVVKQGVDTRRFKYVDRKKKDKFVFGTVGYMDERKNWNTLVQAFTSEFNEHEPVELWIKNSNGYFNHVRFRDERIKVINRMYSFDEIIRLYALFDCFVFPSHAEGSGLPPREAMATGLPVILTNWSGLTEVCDANINYPLTPVAIDVPDVRGPEQPGFMSRIDPQELMYWMRHVYENRDEAKEKGKKAAEFIKKDWNWDSCALDMYKTLEVIDHG